MDPQRCQCCDEERAAPEMVRCNGVGLHLFCVPCVQRRIVLDDLQRRVASDVAWDASLGEHETPCVFGRACEGVFSQEIKDAAWMKARKRVAERLEAEERIHASGLQGLWKCPFCWQLSRCGSVEGETEFWCRNEWCQRTSCRRCRKEAHRGTSCNPVFLPMREPKSRMADDPDEPLPCPGCGLRVPRGGSGCNLITCPCMRVVLCGLCGEDVTYQGYAHFSPYVADEDVDDGRYVGLCPLFQSWASRRGWA